MNTGRPATLCLLFFLPSLLCDPSVMFKIMLLIYVSLPFPLRFYSSNGQGKKEGRRRRSVCYYSSDCRSCVLENRMMMVNQWPAPMGKLEEEVTRTSL